MDREEINNLVSACSELPKEDIVLLSDNLKLAIEYLKKEKKETHCYSQCMKIYNDFIIHQTGVKAKIDGHTGKSLKNIIKYFKGLDKVRDDNDVIKAFTYIFVKYEDWENFHKQQLKLNQIDSNLQNIINSIKNGKQKSNYKQSEREKRIDSVDELHQNISKLLEEN